MKKGKTNWGLVVILVLAALFFTGGLASYGFKPPMQTQSAGGTPTTPTAPSALTSNVCQTGGSNTVNINTPNLLATTASLYSPGTISIYDSNGAFLATGTSAATNAYTSLSAPCGPSSYKGSAYVLASTSGVGTLVNSVKGSYDVSNGVLVQSVTLGTKNTTSLCMVIRNTALANLTDTGSGVCALVNSANETLAVAMAANDIRSGYFDVQGNTGASQFGSDDGGLLWSIDTVDSTVFSDSALSLSSSQITLQSVPCPQRAVSFNSANRCYKSGPIKTSDGLVRISWTLSADLGNPATTSDPFVYIDDVQYFDEDGKVVQDIVNKGGTNIGLVRQQFTINNS